MDECSSLLQNELAIDIAGVLKWFDIEKGYGFIVPDGGVMPDVLLHVSCLSRDGFKAVYEGARIKCKAWRGPKGLQCFRIFEIDNSTAVSKARISSPYHDTITVVATSGFERVQVKWFNRLRGFGFLTRGEGTPDIFVHVDTLRRFGVAQLRTGDWVTVRHGPNPTKGGAPMATEIHPESVRA